ncbi:hypothetical protein ACWOFR_10400 [Carnobacterium gallinarum]|uniref:hypothetical protein n=1 Tax=Carnobacterium gallinarum TaxID=2749 RepID=UPI0005549C00|nr:hypothetical protein [Carnobacterium gallinarum]
MKKNSRVVNEEYLDIEDELKGLKKANLSIENAYSDFQNYSRKEFDLWESIRRLSSGTEAEASVLREFDYLEEERHFFYGKLAEGEEELEQVMKSKIKKRVELEESLFEVRKEENKCHE